MKGLTMRKPLAASKAPSQWALTWGLSALSFLGLPCAEQEGRPFVCLSAAMISLAPPLNTKDPSPRVSYL